MDVQSDHSTGVEWEGERTRFSEIARADFDGKGNEKVLVFRQTFYAEGSLKTTGALILLTRSRPEGPFQVRTVW